jgi:signal transduction histidine kinase
MRRWFDTLPIHRKLVTVALAVTTVALAFATLGLLVVDLWQYRQSTIADTETLAQVLAEHTQGAVQFDRPEAAEESLGSIRVLPAVRRACLYLPDGKLYAGVARTADLACRANQDVPGSLTVVVAEAPIAMEGKVLGTIVVERDLAEIRERVLVTASIAAGMLLVAGTIAAGLAHRLTRRVSTPITKLATAAGKIGHEGQDRQPLQEIAAPPDEVGQLVDAFRAMVGRLLESNETLRREIAERRKVEVEREALLERERHTSRLKDEFLAAVSHELRTPLNAILGWVQMLGTTELDAEMTTKAIASIGRNARAQTRVIEDLIDVSRIVTGKLHLRIEPTDLRGVVESAVEVIRPVALGKRIVLEVRMPAEPCVVNGDQDRLRQVVWNLLSNAVKFTPAEGKVSVDLQSSGGMYELSVSDTGPGIKTEFLPFVFDRFRQGDGSMTREHGGLGLGLSIVKELTEVHGGSVSVTSPGEGQGSTFFVRLAPITASMSL